MGLLPNLVVDVLTDMAWKTTIWSVPAASVHVSFDWSYFKAQIPYYDL